MIPIHCSLGCPKKRRHQRLNHTSSPNRIPRRHVTTSTLPSTLDDRPMDVHHIGPSLYWHIISVASTYGTVSALYHAPRAPTAYSCCPVCHLPSFCWQVRDDTLLKINVPSMVHCYLLRHLLYLWLWFSKAPPRIELEPHTWPPPC
jgi:hypothetical protein